MNADVAGDVLAEALRAVLELHQEDARDWGCATCDADDHVSGRKDLWPCETYGAITAALGCEAGK